MLIYNMNKILVYQLYTIFTLQFYLEHKKLYALPCIPLLTSSFLKDVYFLESFIL